MHSNLPVSTKPLVITSSSKVALSFHRVRDRLDLACPVMFAGAPFIGEGILHNLSQTGCRIECERSVLEGSYITIRLLLPDDGRSLSIDLAAVRWVREQYFGIEFLRISTIGQVRLERILRQRQRG